MGNNNRKELKKNNPYKHYGGQKIHKPYQPPPNELSENDLMFLMNETGSSKEDIKSLYQRFKYNNPNGKMDRSQFIQIYSDLRYGLFKIYFKI
jgi:hypothetical protein